MIDIRRTRPIDLVRMSLGEFAPVESARFVGWTAWAGRRVVAIGGVTVGEDRKLWGYFMAADDYRGRYRFTQHRLAVRLLRRLGRFGLDVWATCEAGRAGAREWLDRLGFIPTGEYRDDSEIMKLSRTP